MAFQYVEVLKLELVKAYDASKPVNGHDWSEMQCTEGLCVTDDNKVGIGTSEPSEKLEVNGNILISGTGDVCNGSGKCLNSAFQTNVIAGNNPVCPSGQTAIMKAYNGTWYTSSQVSSWNQVACGQLLSSDGTTLLVNNQHTSGECTSAGGTVVSDGTNNMCRFNSSSCPSSGNWQQYNNWSTTSATTVSVASQDSCTTGHLCGPCSVSTGSHAWGNVAIESIPKLCNKASYVGETPTCTCEYSGSPQACTGLVSIFCTSGSASRIQIGCY